MLLDAFAKDYTSNPWLRAREFQIVGCRLHMSGLGQNFVKAKHVKIKNNLKKIVVQMYNKNFQFFKFMKKRTLRISFQNKNFFCSGA